MGRTVYLEPSDNEEEQTKKLVDAVHNLAVDDCIEKILSLEDTSLKNIVKELISLKTKHP